MKSDAGSTAWTSDASSATFGSPSYGVHTYGVQNGEFRFNRGSASSGDGGYLEWSSESLDISAYDLAGVTVSVDYREAGPLEPEDVLQLGYRVDGGSIVWLV